MILKPSQLNHAIKALIRTRRAGYVKGQPGIGKSQIFKQVADEIGYAFYDMRAVLLDPVDLRGFPYVKDGVTHSAPPEFLPTKGPAIVLIDEINAAPALVQAALYQYVLDGRVGEHIRPADVYVFAAGNRDSDGAVTTRMGTALRSRFVQMELQPDLEDWVAHAIKSGFHPAIIAFLKQWRPNLLNDFDKNAASFPCPRTWEFASDILHAEITDRVIEHSLIEGCVGPGATSELMTYLRMYRDLPSHETIIKNPDKAPVPKEPSTVYALAIGLAVKTTAETFEPIMRYMARVPIEYLVLYVKTAVEKCSAIERTRAFIKFAVEYKDAIGARGGSR